MAFPWLRLLDAALGMTDIARRVKPRRPNWPRELADRSKRGSLASWWPR